MQIDIPKIKWDPRRLTAKTLDSEEHLIVFADNEAEALQEFPYGETMRERVHRASRNLKDAHPFVFDLPNQRGTHVSLAGIKSQANAFELLTLGRRLAAAHLGQGARRIAIVTIGLNARDAERALEACIAALLAGTLA